VHPRYVPNVPVSPYAPYYYSRWNPYSLYSIYDHLSGGRQSCSLAQLWRDQGKIAEARDLVAPVYNWFTERLDTPVLEEARKLLQSIP
jgi:hypothetical protein